MITNQYLRPEYLTPLPTTLDAKKSPLALLAQTCSAIGADSPNPKLLSSSSEKSSRGSSHKSTDSLRDKSSPTSSVSNTSANEMPVKSSFKPYEMNNRDKTKSPEERSTSAVRVRTPKNSNTPSQNGRCGSNQSASSHRASPTAGRRTPSERAQGGTTSPSRDSPTMSRSGDSGSSIGGPIHSPSPASGKLTSSVDNAMKDLPLGTFKPGSIPISSAFMGGFPSPSYMDLMAASTLMSQHHQALKAAAMNPYFSYARMKPPAGADTMMSACRDPYCTGCSLGPHMLSGKNSTCPAGCTQCDHPGSKASPGYSLSGHGAAAAAYAHAQLAALAAASQLPYVCNWIAGDAAYCGKRFSNSEELLQHLRTHTSAISEAGGSLSMLSPAGLHPSHPLFHRTYPTPPLSPLATARYHPYTKPSLLPPSMAPPSLGGLGMPPHPSLAYFSPYSLYGPRLGAAPGMHP